MRFLRALDRLWCLGRTSECHYVRFYPNPGFMTTIAGHQVKWSKFYGLSHRRVT